MGSSERLHLRWNDFESCIKLGFSELRKDDEFLDVTIACGSKQIKAHKVILSACSPFFRSIIKSVPHQHPLLYLRGIKFSHLKSLLCFMYNGEVNVLQEELNGILSLAEELQIRGLAQNQPYSPPSWEEEPPTKKPRVINGINKQPRSKSSMISSKYSSSKVSREKKSFRGGQTSTPQTVLIVQNDDVQDVDVIKEEQKFDSLDDNSEYPNYDLYKEKYDVEQEYMPESSDIINYQDESSTMDPALLSTPGPSEHHTNRNEDYSSDQHYDLVNEIEDLIDRLSVQVNSAKHFKCRVCSIRPRDSTDNRKHVITHISRHHDPFVGEKPGLLNRIDAYIDSQTFEDSNEKSICRICNEVVGPRVIPLRRHFLVNHLKRRVKKNSNVI